MNNKNRIIKHYKKFFDLHAKGIALDEDDHLNIDWVEDLLKKCFIPNVIHWVAVADEKPDDSRWVLTSNIIDEWVDRAEYDEEQGYWWNGECEIIPTHWAELPKPPCV